MSSEKFPMASMGAKRRVKHEQTLERGPPSAPAEFVIALIVLFYRLYTIHKNMKVVFHFREKYQTV